MPSQGNKHNLTVIMLLKMIFLFNNIYQPVVHLGNTSF
ncbi:hypothetical protein EZS27_012222 [termite gut metagenome]|uniref:Uncharacterized protein n=1 Tax=termite gut metagenome TaxID=433724 RepID=A0A5J4S111_9ZZZZ